MVPPFVLLRHPLSSPIRVVFFCCCVCQQSCTVPHFFVLGTKDWKKYDKNIPGCEMYVFIFPVFG